MRVEEIRALPHYREPAIGEKVCVGSRLYMGHGRDDFHGGMATIASVEVKGHLPSDHFNRTFIKIEEDAAFSSYNWLSLMRDEPENIEHYGKDTAHPDPDLRPEFNPPGGW